MKKLLLIFVFCFTLIAPQLHAEEPGIFADEEEVLMLPCYENGGLDILSGIVEKCGDENLKISSFTQKEFSFMLDFCNEFINAMEDAEKKGEEESFMENTKEEYGLTIGFAIFLMEADDEKLLNEENHARLEAFDERMDL